MPRVSHLVLVASLFLLAPARLAEEAPPDLPMVQAQEDPVRALLQQIASPTLSEAAAQRLFDELILKGPNVLPSLASAFRDPTEEDTVVWIAARGLGHLGGSGAVHVLVDGLSDPRVMARLGAVSGLTLVRDAAAVEPLERALKDPAVVVRAHAADALAAIGDRRSSKALSAALDLPENFHDGRSLFVRHHIVAALGSIGSIGGVDALIRTLSDPDPDLARLASRGLSGITGMRFRETNASAEAPPSDAEVEQWRAWWKDRRVLDAPAPRDEP